MIAFLTFLSALNTARAASSRLSTFFEDVVVDEDEGEKLLLLLAGSRRCSRMLKGSSSGEGRMAIAPLLKLYCTICRCT
jgi:hypothetical protein